MIADHGSEELFLRHDTGLGIVGRFDDDHESQGGLLMRHFAQCFRTCSDAGPADLQEGTITIHPTPNRSVSMPKHGEKNVFVSGICTFPPSASVVNARSAAATSATVSDREKPWKLDGSEHPSVAITVVSPMRTRACISLFCQPGGTLPGGGGSGLSLYRMSIVISAASAF